MRAFVESNLGVFFGIILEKNAKEILLGNSVRDTLQYVCQNFRVNGYRDPGVDESGNTAFKLSRILSGYKKQDPNLENQNTLPLIIFKRLYFNHLNTKNLN